MAKKESALLKELSDLKEANDRFEIENLIKNKEYFAQDNEFKDCVYIQIEVDQIVE